MLTPVGIAGIAVVRVAPSEKPHVMSLLRDSAGRAVDLWAAAAPRRAALVIDDAVVDDVLAIDRGASGFELHLHGSAAVLDALRQRFEVVGASPRSSAERLLRQALSVEQLQLGIEQCMHDFDLWLRRLHGLSPDERLYELRSASQRSVVAMALANPERVALIGRQNAGKSTLFNRLLARERVVTGPEPGLTRDAVDELTTLLGYPYRLVDTAGWGASPHPVDAAAMVAGEMAGCNGIRVLVVDGCSGPDDEDRRLAARCQIVVSSKSDLPQAGWPQDVRCDLLLSCRPEESAAVRGSLGQRLRDLRRLPPAGPVGGVAALHPTQWGRLSSALRAAEFAAASG